MDYAKQIKLMNQLAYWRIKAKTTPPLADRPDIFAVYEKKKNPIKGGETVLVDVILYAIQLEQRLGGAKAFDPAPHHGVGDILIV